MRRLRRKIIVLVSAPLCLVLSLNFFTGLMNSMHPKVIAKEPFYFSDLVSSYSRLSSTMRYPSGDTFKIRIRIQSEWRPLENPVVDLFPVIGRNGENVYKCKENCKSMPDLHTPDDVIILNEWKGTWYFMADRRLDVRQQGGPPYTFGMSEGKQWVQISREQFPKELAIDNMDFSIGNPSYMVRDSTRETFSMSHMWISHKFIWLYLERGILVGSYVNELSHIFSDREAFAFFLKYIKPHWKFGNPVLDMDFTPYEGMDPGQIPFPEEVGK